MTSDESLILEFQQGSRDALELLFARYRGPLFGFFRRRIRSRERAEEMVQETFLAVIRAASRYEPRSLVRTYLYGIGLKLLAEERRREAKVEAPLESITKSISEPAINASADTILCIRQAMERLDPIDRDVLMLREYEQLSYREIAQLLRVPVNTVRSRLFRARMAMRDELQSHPKSNWDEGCARSFSLAEDAALKDSTKDSRTTSRLSTSEQGGSK